MNLRTKALLDSLKEKEVDAIIIYGDINRRYLSSFKGSSGYLYISEKQCVLLTDFRYIEQATKQSPDFQIVDYVKEGLLKNLDELTKQDGVKSLGFEADILTYNQHNQLKEGLSTVSLVGLNDEVEKIRAIKDSEEISYIKEAAKIADSAFTHILSFIKTGMTEIEVALELEFFMKRKGAKKLSFDTIMASGKNSSLPHAEPSNKKIEKGDFVTMDFGCVYNGYCSDMTRTIVMGKANDKQKEVYNTVLKAQLAALEILKAGLTGLEVDKVARDIIYNAGYEGYFGHGLGHSVGLEVHENPRLSVKGLTELKENMIVTVEPGIYIPDFGGVRIEDLVCVNTNGYENFTHSDKSLIEL